MHIKIAMYLIWQRDAYSVPKALKRILEHGQMQYIYSNAHSSRVVPYLGKPESRLQTCCHLTGNSPGPTSLCKLGI